MPTPTEVIEQIIDPLPEDVAELPRAIEGDLVHIAGPETITGAKRFTSLITAAGGITGVFSGDIAAGRLTGPLDLNGQALQNVGASGFEQLDNKGNANGYAPLGASALVPMEYLGTDGVGDGTNFLADDGTFKPISAGSVSFGTQLANRVFAGPTTGSAAAPGFRALVAADIPTLAQSQITNLVTDLAAKVPTARTIAEGAGLAGNTYDLSANRTLAMGTPSTLSVGSSNSASGTTHSHAISSSASPGENAALLATDADGLLTLFALRVLDNIFINAATSNLFLKDTSTGFQVSTTGILNPQAGNIWRSTSYTSGIRGWNIDDDGNAEFNDLTARGAIKSSVFQVNEIAATAGTQGVFKSAATIYADFTTPASTSSSFTFQAKNSDAGGMLFAVGDIIRFKTWTGSGISDSWATITARTNNTTYTQYTATLNSGSTSATFRAGSAAIDYGPSGTGFITLSADGTVGSSPNMTMATHAGSPWSAQTTLLRAGNLNGSYGHATNVYGVGIGQYGAAASWITVDTTNGIRIGNNTTVLGSWDASGIVHIGETGTGKTFIAVDSTNGYRVLNGTTVLGEWLPNGDIRIGQTGSGKTNLYVTAGGVLNLRNDTTSILTLDTTNGFQVLNPSGTSLIQLDTSGNARFGQVATNKANVYYNASNSRLEFRGSTNGTVVQSYIDTDGSFKFNGGYMKLDSNGITANISGAASPLVFRDNSANVTGDLTQPAASQTQLTGVGITTGNIGRVTLLAANSGGFGATIDIQANGSAAPTASKHFIKMHGQVGNFLGVAIGESTPANPSHMLEVNGTGYFTGALSFLVGGAIKTAEVGAADSGGTGYKMLRVPN